MDDGRGSFVCVELIDRLNLNVWRQTAACVVRFSDLILTSNQMKQKHLRVIGSKTRNRARRFFAQRKDVVRFISLVYAEDTRVVHPSAGSTHGTMSEASFIMIQVALVFVRDVIAALP